MRIPIISTLLTLFLVAIGSSADKDDFDTANPDGRPKFSAGSATRFAVWHDGSGWHVRSTAPRTTGNQFTLTMSIVGGKVGILKPVNAEKKAAKGAPADVGSWNKERTQFQFTMNTAKNGEDGFDFDVSEDATSIKFSVKIDGREITDAIVIGSKNDHPAKATFTLPAHPVREKKSK